jgi:tetratricopeptide (TPR) repeat protein
MKIAYAFLTIVLLFASNRASGQEAPDAQRDAARALARRGAVYFDNRDWENAADSFHRSYDIVKAPTLALMEGRALAELGRLVEAGDAYARAVSLKPALDNEPYRRAQADAVAELAALRRRIPSVEIVVRTADGSPLEVRVDGVHRSDFAAMSLNPGSHVVSVRSVGAADRVRSFALVEAENRTIVFEPLGPAGSPAGPRGVADESSRSATSGWMWTAFGVGGAGLATGVVAGALALDRKASLDRACQDAACPPDQEPELRDYRRLRTVSLVGYVVGFVGVAGGVVILASRPKGPSSSNFTATVGAGPSGLLVSGGF